MAARPISPKVAGSTGAGSIVGTLACWVVGVAGFGAPADAAHASAAIGAVPWPIVAAIVALATFAGGYIPSDEASALFAVEDPEQYDNAMGDTTPAAGPSLSDLADPAAK